MISKFLFLSCAYSASQKNIFLKKSKRGYQFAAQNLQEAIIEGFIDNNARIEVLSIPALSTFPFGNRQAFVEDTDFIFEDKKIGKSYGFINVPFLKNAKEKKILKRIDEWYNKGAKHCIIVYALLYPQMKIAVEAKKRHPDINLCIIVPDLTRFMSYNRIATLLGLVRRTNEKINRLVPQFDAFVVLAQPMIKELGVENKPYTVIEGIYRKDPSSIKNSDNSLPKEKIVFYGGALSVRYGIVDLIDAFMIIKNSNYRLWLCGTGDAVPYINKAAAEDNRIEYKGVVGRTEIEAFMDKATLLVNPRHSDEEFTKYSFPSKTLDYMASGKPTLMSHLNCIPSDYDDYLNYFVSETKEGIAESIQNICEMDGASLIKKGECARSFILRNKNPYSQVNKIIQLVNEL